MKDIKAMIFAAGLGTRLRPLTNDRPKALVQINGQTLLEIQLRKLKQLGIKEIIVNIHHFPDLMIQHIEAARKKLQLDITIADERDKLLETGGGLRAAEAFFHSENPFLVLNVDILSDIKLEALLDKHLEEKAIATLAVRKRTSSRYLLATGDQLAGWRNLKTEEKIIVSESEVYEDFAFSGIQILSPRIFKYLKACPEEKFSTIPVFLEAAKSEKIVLWDHSEDAWLDVGKLPALELAPAVLEKMSLWES